MDDEGGHGFVDLAGQLDEACGTVELARSPAEVEGVDRDAVAADAGAGVEGLEAEGLGGGRVDDLRESPALTIFDLLQHAGAEVAYNDPFFPEVGAGRKYALKRHSTPLDRIAEFDCALLVTDHSAYDIPTLVAASKLFVDTRNATSGLDSPNIIRC